MFGWITLLLAAIYLLAASHAWWWWLVWLVAAVGWREHRKERRRQKSERVELEVAITASEHRGRGAFRRLVNRRPKRADVEERDAWEGSFWDAPDPKSVDATLEIRYRDADGNRTSRVVDVRRFDNTLYGGVMIGHCRLRDASRTFRFDRVVRCVDLDTGEIVSDVKDFLNALYEESPERTMDSLTTDYLDVAKVLFFVAKADGQFRREEKHVIADFLRQLLRDHRVTPELVDDGLRKVDVPSLHGFKLAVGRVMNGGEVNPQELRECCHAIVATQNAVHPSEQAALDYIDRRCPSYPGT